MTQNQTISGAAFKDMLIFGNALLEKNKAYIDELNVFPVPDGDTGTNMSMTMNAAVREIKNVEPTSIGQIAELMARGALRGARGNSGVILSQIFRGLSQAFQGKDLADAQVWVSALQSASDAAYKAVMKPKEGTILTVMKEVARLSQDSLKRGANVYRVIDDMIINGEVTLARTPDLLPVLKEAGVVDSGGAGLMMIFRGFKMLIDGDSLEDIQIIKDEIAKPESSSFSDNSDVVLMQNPDDIEFAYCTEFFVEHLNTNFKPEQAEELLSKLQNIGDSVVVVNDMDLIKVHLHTNVPGKALQAALRYGELNGIKIENMKEQSREIQRERKGKEKEFGMVAVSVGDGLDKIFKDLSVDSIVSGGQTMNPSAEDIVQAIRRVNARQIFVLPNNKNIVLAAQQAAEIIEKETEMRVFVLPSKSVVQGVAAALAFADHDTAKQKLDAMKEAMEAAHSCAVTYAVRDTTIQGKHIGEGDYMSLIDGDIATNGKQMGEVLDSSIARMMKEFDGEFISLFYGKDVKKEDAEIVAKRVEEKYPDADVLLQYGGQPLYYYFVSVE